MAAKPHPSSLLLGLIANLLLVALASADDASIATYWGQNLEEGRLSKACATGNYDYINIAFLTTFGSGQDPVLHLAGHCNVTARGGCTALAREIKDCQRRGVKLMLSLGGESGRQSLNSTDDARQVAEYLYNNFLGGKSASRPFGNAVLDGVDFAVAAKVRKDRLHWEDLAAALAGYSSEGRKVYLTAAPQCSYPDKTLKKALASGVFDVAWVRFYSHASCQYSAAGAMPLKLSWERWNAKLQVGKVFIGLPASGDAVQNGYVPPENFTTEVLPFISNFPKYGGVMLWDRYYDLKNKYSDQVRCEVKTCEEDNVSSI